MRTFRRGWEGCVGPADRAPDWRCFNEDDAFVQLTLFNGQTIRVFDGKVDVVL